MTLHEDEDLARTIVSRAATAQAPDDLLDRVARARRHRTVKIAASVAGAVSTGVVLAAVAFVMGNGHQSATDTPSSHPMAGAHIPATCPQHVMTTGMTIWTGPETVPVNPSKVIRCVYEYPPGKFLNRDAPLTDQQTESGDAARQYAALINDRLDPKSGSPMRCPPPTSTQDWIFYSGSRPVEISHIYPCGYVMRGGGKVYPYIDNGRLHR